MTHEFHAPSSVRNGKATVEQVKDALEEKRAGQQPAQLLAKHQPCGCIVCTCADDVRCHGCGARHCGTHPVGQIPNAVYERQPAQPGSGEVVKPVQRYHIRHLIDGDNVLDWPRDLRKGPDVVLASDYDRLQSELTAAQQRIAALESENAAANRQNAEAFTRVDELRGGLLAAREWLQGWASAEPYLSIIEEALYPPRERLRRVVLP